LDVVRSRVDELRGTLSLQTSPGQGTTWQLRFPLTLASTRALQSEPGAEAYAAAKGGVVALTHALAASLAGRVRVNCICPGWIDVSGPAYGPGRRQADLSARDHAQHWAGRVGTPEDIAGAVLHLAGAGFTTGQILVVDGGMTRTMLYA
ncbi:MAG: SDR family oxidoreductase, partial [Planctomycetes bacterium]|nr:SDR family oxidoreductase [Planctomycetota bacterium]